MDLSQEHQDFIGYGLASIMERQVRLKVAREVSDYLIWHEQKACCNDLGEALWCLVRDGA